MSFSNKNPVLLLVDIQRGLDELEYWGGERNNPEAERCAARLLTLWREYQLPVIHIKHNSTDPVSRLAPGRKGNEIKEEVRPLKHELIIEKEVNSAFIGTDLLKRLESLKSKVLVIVGLTTDHCVSTTARMAGNLGYTTYVVSDATAAFCKTGMDGTHYPAQLVHEIELAALHGEFATVLSSAELNSMVEGT